MKTARIAQPLFACLLWMASNAVQAKEHSFDVVVFGATPGGNDGRCRAAREALSSSMPSNSSRNKAEALDADRQFIKPVSR